MLQSKEKPTKEFDENNNIPNKSKIIPAKTKSADKINNDSNNSSINTSYSKKIQKSKRNSRNNSRKGKQMKIDNDLFKNQSKIIKDFLTPILKEENARQLVLFYSKKMNLSKNPSSKRNRNCSLNNRSILDYSFVNEKSKKAKIPLFQILYPNQYKKHLEKKNKGRHMSAPNIQIPINFEKKKINKRFKRGTIANIDNQNIVLNKIQNNKINKKKNNQNTISSMSNTINSKSSQTSVVRAKTPPLYLRLKDVQTKHEKEIDKLRKKYEYNYKNNSNYSSSQNESSKTRNKTRSPYDFERWYNYEKTWQKLKILKINMLKKEIEENKLFINEAIKEEETFKPKLNKNTENLMNKRYDEDFYSRLKAYQNNKINKRKILQEKLKPRFKPFINTNYEIRSEYYDYMKYDQKLINKDFNFFFEKF